jgi:Na+/H+-dicarboxylate symporter
MIAGVCSLQETGAQTGKLAKITLIYFASTTITAVVLGLFLVVTIQPGAGGGEWIAQPEEGEVKATDKSMTQTILDIFLQLFPPNIVQAAATMNVLGVVTFSLFFGTMLSRLGPSGATLINVLSLSSSPALPPTSLSLSWVVLCLPECLPPHVSLSPSMPALPP